MAAHIRDSVHLDVAKGREPKGDWRREGEGEGEGEGEEGGGREVGERKGERSKRR